MKVMVIPIAISALGTPPKGLARWLEDLLIGGRTETIVKIGHNLKKSPGDLRTFAVTETPIKDYLLMMV